MYVLLLSRTTISHWSFWSGDFKQRIVITGFSLKERAKDDDLFIFFFFCWKVALSTSSVTDANEMTTRKLRGFVFVHIFSWFPFPCYFVFEKKKRKASRRTLAKAIEFPDHQMALHYLNLLNFRKILFLFL